MEFPLRDALGHRQVVLCQVPRSTYSSLPCAKSSGNRPRGAQHLGDERVVVADQVQLQAVEVGPLAGDVTPAGEAGGQAAAGCADVFTDWQGEGIQNVVLHRGQLLQGNSNGIQSDKLCSRRQKRLREGIETLRFGIGQGKRRAASRRRGRGSCAGGRPGVRGS